MLPGFCRLPLGCHAQYQGDYLLAHSPPMAIFPAEFIYKRSKEEGILPMSCLFYSNEILFPIKRALPGHHPKTQYVQLT
jgi:hypothetical protein